MIYDRLGYLLPAFLYVDILILLGLLVHAVDFGRAAAAVRTGRFWKKAGPALAIVVLAFVVVATVPPRTNRIYYDEHIYMMIGQNIAEHGRAVMGNHVSFRHGDMKLLATELNKEPNTWPALVSLFFKVFGTNEMWGQVLNNLALIAGAAGVGVIVFLLLGSPWYGGLAALVHFTIPHNLIWSNTAAVEPVGAALAVLSVALALWYCRHPRNLTLYILAAVLVLTVQVRHESLLIVPVVGLILLFHDWRIVKNVHLWAATALFAVLCIPHFVHIFVYRHNPWGASGPKFSLQHVPNNLKTNTLYYLVNGEFPVLVTLSALVGMVFSRRVGIRHYALLLWFGLAWGIFIPFYAGSYEYGADVRFALMSFAPLSIFAVLGIEWLDRKLNRHGVRIGRVAVVAVMLQFVTFLPFIRRIGQEAWGSRLDHHYAIEFAKEVPDDGLILTHNPNMFLLREQSAAQMSILTYNPQTSAHLFRQYPGGLYLHWNYWCNVADDVQNSFATNILDRYECSLLREHRDQNMRYALYRIKGAGAQTTGCKPPTPIDNGSP